MFVLVCTFLSPYCCRPCPSPGFHAHFCTYITRIRRRTLHRIYPRTRTPGAGQTVVVSLRGWYPRQVSVTSIVSVPHVWLMFLGWLMRRPSAILPSFLLVLPLSLSRFQLDAWLDLSFVNTGLVSIQTTRAPENSTTNSRLTSPTRSTHIQSLFHRPTRIPTPTLSPYRKKMFGSTSNTLVTYLALVLAMSAVQANSDFQRVHRDHVNLGRMVKKRQIFTPVIGAGLDPAERDPVSTTTPVVTTTTGTAAASASSLSISSSGIPNIINSILSDTVSNSANYFTILMLIRSGAEIGGIT